MAKATLITRACPICKAKPARLLVYLDSISKFEAGAHVDAAFPYLNPEAKERIVSGVCGQCMSDFYEV